MTLGGVWAAFLLLDLIVLAAPLPQSQSTFKVGAWGDDASRNNLGVQAQIETHTYVSPQNSLDYFWVGDDLSDGAFIQFGFSLEPGNYCLNGVVKEANLACTSPTERVADGDGRWQWQYWPNRFVPEYYFQIGPQASAGVNGSTHVYTILPGPSSSWSFALDGRVIANTTFALSRSQDPVLVVAEGSASNVTRSLGPVRFDNISYFNGVKWTQVNSLVALSYCGISVGCAANQYGADSIGADSIIAGSGVPRATDGTLLWTSELVQLSINVHPGVQFILTSALGQDSFSGNASVQVPEGMFAYISLPDTASSSPGLLGWVGGQDRFQGWEGSIESKNLTIVVLMDSDKEITATWSTDYSTPITIGVLGLLIVAIIAFAKRYSKTRSH